jgi:hypothetical protein
MTSAILTNALLVGEPLLYLIALLLFRRNGDHKRFSAMEFYLAIRAVSTPVLELLPYGPASIDKHSRYVVYFALYWSVYLICAVSIFFVMQQLFRYLLRPLPGLARIGLFVFRWAAVVSVIVAVASTVLPTSGKISVMVLPNMGRELMRCMSVMELCLLAFLALSVNVLGLSFRSRAFGIGLGFGMIASLEFICSAFLSPAHTLLTVLNIANESAVLIAITVWIAYSVMPEPERKPIMLPVSSPLLRWNEIATALGYSHTQVVVTASNPGFLSDVENVVDRVLTKNSLNTAG